MDRLDPVRGEADFMKPLRLALQPGGANGGSLRDDGLPVSAQPSRADLGAVKMAAHHQIHAGGFDGFEQFHQRLHHRATGDLQGQQRVMQHQDPAVIGGSVLKLLLHPRELVAR